MISVIIADDDIKTRKVLTDLIDWKQLDAEIISVVSNGLDAKKAIQEHVADVIISDIRMPFVDGLELAGYIQKNKLDIHVILLSAYAEFEYAQTALRYNVTDYILKPLNSEKLNVISNIIKNISAQKTVSSKIDLCFNNPDFISDIRNGVLDLNIKKVNDIVSNYAKNISQNPNDIKDYYYRIICVFIQIANEMLIDTTELDSYLLLLNKTYGIDYPQHLLKALESLINAVKLQQTIAKTSKLDVLKVIDYIKLQLSNYDLSASKVANHFDISLSYLCNEFKKSAGITLSKMIIQLRLKDAAQLLTKTNIPIHNIATKVGYENTQYFNKLFKRYYNATPSEYRNKDGKL